MGTGEILVLGGSEVNGFLFVFLLVFEIQQSDYLWIFYGWSKSAMR